MALREYPEEPSVIDGEKVKIEIKSEQFNVFDADIFNLTSVAPVVDSDDKAVSVTLKSEGVLKREDGKVSLSYSESTQTEMGNTNTTLVFDCNNPKSVFIQRRGAVETDFIIEEGVLHFSKYLTLFDDMDIATIANKVSLEERGSLGLIKLDYVVELRGLTAQRTRMTIKILKK